MDENESDWCVKIRTFYRDGTSNDSYHTVRCNNPLQAFQRALPRRGDVLRWEDASRELPVAGDRYSLEGVVQ